MREEILHAGLLLLVVGIEYWAMQPVHDPVVARFWHAIMRAAYELAHLLGRIGLHAEHSYYIAVEAGL